VKVLTLRICDIDEAFSRDELRRPDV